MNIYEVCIETRDEYEDVINSDYVYRTTNRNDAIEEARKLRSKYGAVVIETWDAETDNLIDVTFENQY